MTNDPPHPAPTPSTTPLACALSGPEFSGRQAEVARLFQDVQQTEELIDGYAYRFPGSADWATRLLDFVLAERVCCPFFTFALIYEPEHGPIWLHLRGPEGVKALLAAWPALGASAMRP